MTNFRWLVCGLLFVALVVNYLDRQVLSLTWKNFIAPEFGWTDADYGLITGVFSIVYAVSMLFAGKFVDFVGTKRGFMWAIGVWSAGACLHAFCGIATNGIVSGNWIFSFSGAAESLRMLRMASDTAVMVTTVSVWLFLAARCALAGGGGQLPLFDQGGGRIFPQKGPRFCDRSVQFWRSDRCAHRSVYDSVDRAALWMGSLVPFYWSAWFSLDVRLGVLV